jgi:two-component system, NarL family, invasion response regulator UvrY
VGPFLVVDDHSMVREGLGRMLATEFPGARIRYAVSRQDALEAVVEEFFLLAVIDISMPGGNGLGLIPEIKDRSPGTRILVHTMHPEDPFGYQALRCGADGFITKDAPVDQILLAARKILEGGRFVSPALGEVLASVLSTGSGGGAESLSDREFQILRLITSGKTPTEIAEDLRLSVKTISTYRTRILEKLRLRTTAEMIRFGIQHNLDAPG